MRPRTPEQLAAIQKALDDPRGMMLTIMSVASVVGTAPTAAPGPHVIGIATQAADALLDALERISA